MTKILFLATQKTRQLHFTSLHLYENMSMLMVLLWIHSLRQVGHMIEKFEIIWNFTTYRKKEVESSKE